VVSSELSRRLRGRSQMVLTHVDATGDPRPLVGLLRQVGEALGPASPLAFQLEYALEELVSRSRPAAESAAGWADLHARAEAALDPHDTTLMSIKALQARYARLSGGPADRDAAVQSYEVEWRRRLSIFGAQAHRTSTAHANLATALRERGGPADLRRASRIARAEVALRQAVWGPDHAFTWIAEVVLARTLLRIAELPAGARAGGRAPDGAGAAGPSVPRPRADARAVDPAAYPRVEVDDLTRPDADLVTEARQLAGQVLAARRERFGVVSRSAMRAQLVQAHALLLAGRPTSAAAEIRYVLATSRRVGAHLDPGWPELLLARALLAAGLAGEGASVDDALRQARAAVEARQDRYPAGTDRLAEAEQFEQEARRLHRRGQARADQQAQELAGRHGQGHPAGAAPRPATGAEPGADRSRLP
jgi:hypothetical protein